MFKLAINFLLLTMLSHAIYADIIVRELGIKENKPEPFVMPYGFSSESMAL